MTKSLLRLDERGACESYDSAAWFDAEAVPGVRYAVVRVSFGRRIELARRMREIGRKVEFLEAGNDVRDKLEAAVEGLTIDGEKATPEAVIEKGPVGLAAEILARVKAECGLSEDERKN